MVQYSRNGCQNAQQNSCEGASQDSRGSPTMKWEVLKFNHVK